MSTPASIKGTGMSLWMRCIRTYSGTSFFISAITCTAWSVLYGTYFPALQSSYSLVPLTTRVG
ncbi:MAG: hypothetical protein A4E30_00364 [Methanomassiliicoccales archaeon PtaB.Bin215]|nr:MAG: hypothetical protein A4E30_00364 [Methanomassiliicoccales archaeon PtaB.Bin215]